MKKVLLSFILSALILVTGTMHTSAQVTKNNYNSPPSITATTCQHIWVETDKIYLDSWEQYKVEGDTVYFRICRSYIIEQTCTRCGATRSFYKVYYSPWGF